MNSRYATRRKSSGDAGVAFFLYLIIAFPLYIWNGFVLKTIWNWFVPSTFHGVPHLALAQAIGLGLVVAIFTNRRVAKSATEETALEALIIEVLYDLTVGASMLVIGFIVHLFI